MADQTRRAALLSIGLLLTVFAGGLYLSSRILLGRSPLPFGGGSVAVLPIGGVIYADRPFGRDLVALSDRSEVKAFVLEIRSPGGAVGASQDLFGQVRRLREKDDRPVIAWIGDVGASGGYYVALGADSIFALPGSMTGSIGVIMQLPNAEELMKKVGNRSAEVMGSHAGVPVRCVRLDDASAGGHLGRVAFEGQIVCFCLRTSSCLFQNLHHVA